MQILYQWNRIQGVIGMKIKFIKNIAVIIVDITKRPTEEDDKILLETM